jgi:hypothetical protein
MVEHVARALAHEAAERFYFADPGMFNLKFPGGLREYCDANWEKYADDARAAIEAMREPTRLMVCDGGDFVVERQIDEDIRNCWRAMIDAALKETQDD